MTVEDAEGRRSEAVMSPEVTVGKPDWSPKDLSGTWSVSLVVTGFQSYRESTSTTPIGYACAQTLVIQMNTDSTGNVKMGVASGTLHYRDKTIQFAFFEGFEVEGTLSWNYEGNLKNLNGSVTLSGTWIQEQETCSYSGTWTAVKADDGNAQPGPDDRKENSAETAPDLSLYQTLKVGDKNDGVKKMRDRLYDLGYFKKRYDHENFTQSTADIVAEFQKANGLPATGVATPETQSLIFSDNAIPKP